MPWEQVIHAEAGQLLNVSAVVCQIAAFQIENAELAAIKYGVTGEQRALVCRIDKKAAGIGGVSFGVDDL